MSYKRFYMNFQNLLLLIKNEKRYQIFAIAIFKDLIPFKENVTGTNKYWIRLDIADVLQDADQLFLQKNYLEIYEKLNRIKYCSNSEVQWRISRALFKMSCDVSLSHRVRWEMIDEAHAIITNAINLGTICGRGEVHKWMAIITDAKAGLEGTISRVKSFDLVKNHLIESSKINPRDVTVLYMLGKWCFDMSNLSWIQRKLSSLLFISPPTSSYEEAYGYLHKAEEIQPRFYLPNLYLLGRTSLYLKQYFRARYYLHLASQMLPRSDYEKQCAAHAKNLAENLKSFDLSKKALNFTI